MPYVAAQVVGALAGTAIANVMLGSPPFFMSHHVRSGTPLLEGEFLATFGLVATIWGCVRSRPEATPYAVAA